ncbi:MAG: hypothetical protein IJL69_04065, partial [Oscillospiraceae bacterium]|nr:hypothetical protein [Oscillospiraceae bacterium]
MKRMHLGKRIASAVLCALVLAAILPAAIHAEEAEVTSVETLIAALGGEAYAEPGTSELGSDCVRLLQDVDLGGDTIAFTGRKTLVLDLNGRTLSADGAVLSLAENATLVLCDQSPSESGEVLSSGSGSVAAVMNRGHLRLVSGMIRNTGDGDGDTNDLAVFSTKKFVMLGGAIRGTYGGLFVSEGQFVMRGGEISAETGSAAYFCGGEITVEDGLLIGEKKAIHAESTETGGPLSVEIRGGTFDGKTQEGMSVRNYGGSSPAQVVVSGGSFSGPEDGVCLYTADPGVLTLTGGEFLSEEGVYGGVTIRSGVYVDDVLPEDAFTVRDVLGEGYYYDDEFVGTHTVTGDGYIIYSITAPSVRIIDAEEHGAILEKQAQDHADRLAAVIGSFSFDELNGASVPTAAAAETVIEYVLGQKLAAVDSLEIFDADSFRVATEEFVPAAPGEAGVYAFSVIVNDRATAAGFRVPVSALAATFPVTQPDGTESPATSGEPAGTVTEPTSELIFRPATTAPATPGGEGSPAWNGLRTALIIGISVALAVTVGAIVLIVLLTKKANKKK